MQSSLRLTLLTLATILAACPGSVRAGSRIAYSVIDLGGLSDSGASWGTAVNIQGVSAGTAVTTDGSMHAFRRAPGASPQDLGTLDGARGSSYAAAINSFGQVVGTSTSNGVRRAFVTDSSSMKPIPLLSGGRWNEATGINEQGQVVGFGDRGDGTISAFLAGPSGDVRALASLGGDLTKALDINAVGQVTGTARTVSGALRAFRATNNSIVNLGTLSGGGDSFGIAINDAGRVAGYAIDASGREMAFVSREHGGLLALGTLPSGGSSVALDINTLGFVVGRSGSGGSARAFLWNESRGMLDLNRMISPTAGWVLSEASSITDSGLIVGTGLFKGKTRGFTLVPASLPVPEPSSLLLSLPAFLACLALHRRFRRA